MKSLENINFIAILETALKPKYTTHTYSALFLSSFLVYLSDQDSTMVRKVHKVIIRHIDGLTQYAQQIVLSNLFEFLLLKQVKNEQKDKGRMRNITLHMQRYCKLVM